MQTQIVWRLSHSISLNQVYIFRFVGPWNSERSSLSPAIILLDTAYILKLMHHYDDGVGDPLVLNREIKINCSTPRTPRLYLGLATLFVGAFLHSKLSRCVYESNRQFCQYMFFHYNRLWILLNSSSLFLLCLRHVFFLPAAHFSLFSSLLSIQKCQPRPWKIRRGELTMVSGLTKCPLV